MNFTSRIVEGASITRMGHGVWWKKEPVPILVRKSVSKVMRTLLIGWGVCLAIIIYDNDRTEEFAPAIGVELPQKWILGAS